MPNIVPYEDMTVELLHATDGPAIVVGLAASITQHSDPQKDIVPASAHFCKYLWGAEHRSLFEHVRYTFLIQGISRSLLAQITRQRTGSFTSGSQQYQDFRDAPMAVSQELLDNHSVCLQDCLDIAADTYVGLIDSGVLKEEARQVLPNASTSTILFSIDALNLAMFLRQRLCRRNVLEMRVLATKLQALCLEHFPELFIHIGPQCYMGKCMQGMMRCSNPYTSKD